MTDHRQDRSVVLAVVIFLGLIAIAALGAVVWISSSHQSPGTLHTQAITIAGNVLAATVGALAALLASTNTKPGTVDQAEAEAVTQSDDPAGMAMRFRRGTATVYGTGGDGGTGAVTAKPPPTHGEYPEQPIEVPPEPSQPIAEPMAYNNDAPDPDIVPDVDLLPVGPSPHGMEENPAAFDTTTYTANPTEPAPPPK
jgi:hypothetical protein